MNINAIYEPHVSLFLTAYRGRLCLSIHSEDDVVAGWVTSFLTGTVLVWDAKLNQHQVLAQYILN